MWPGQKKRVCFFANIGLGKKIVRTNFGFGQKTGNSKPKQIFFDKNIFSKQVQHPILELRLGLKMLLLLLLHLLSLMVLVLLVLLLLLRQQKAKVKNENRVWEKKSVKGMLTLGCFWPIMWHPPLLWRVVTRFGVEVPFPGMDNRMK